MVSLSYLTVRAPERLDLQHVDGAVVPSEAESIEDPQTPDVMTKPAEHSLQQWCASSFFFLYTNT